MILENFEFGYDNISIEWAGIYLDLHNCFDFTELQYHTLNQSLTLIWQRSNESWAQSTPVLGFKLVFDRVTYLQMIPRDLAYPFSEDTCLRDLSFVPQTERDDFDNVYDIRYRSETDDLKFVFQSESGIKLSSRTATFVAFE